MFSATSPAQYLSMVCCFPCKGAIPRKPPSSDSEPDFVGYSQRFTECPSSALGAEPRAPYPPKTVATFRVGFDGKWQGDFDTLADAEEWAKEASLAGRVVFVIERRLLGNRFRAAFPEERAEEAEAAWKDWRGLDVSGGAG
jgi:hypothetical protein